VYEENAIANISRKLHPERRKFVKFYEIPVADKVEQWKKVEYEGKAFADNMPVIKTRNGLRVRSKSEVIIADAFSEYKIPFRYKYPLKAGSSGVIYPDFTVLNPRTGQEFIFEHFERLSDPKYFRIMQTKLELYATCGYFLGENLLYTMGSNESLIDIEYLDKLIKHFLL